MQIVSVPLNLWLLISRLANTLVLFWVVVFCRCCWETGLVGCGSVAKTGRPMTEGWFECQFLGKTLQCKLLPMGLGVPCMALGLHIKIKMQRFQFQKGRPTRKKTCILLIGQQGLPKMAAKSLALNAESSTEFKLVQACSNFLSVKTAIKKYIYILK